MDNDIEYNLIEFQVMSDLTEFEAMSDQQRENVMTVLQNAISVTRGETAAALTTALNQLIEIHNAVLWSGVDEEVIRALGEDLNEAPGKTMVN